MKKGAQRVRLWSMRSRRCVKAPTWQLTMKFHNGFIEHALPQDSKRRKWYDLGLKGMRILLNEGLLSFCHNFKNKFLDEKNNNSKYKLWIQNNEPNGYELEIMNKESRNFPYRPKISIITPVWNTDELWLKAAIESVMAQIYNKWELCIVDGGSTKQHVKEILENYARKDERIKVKFLNENMGISGNSNEAFSMSSGEFIGFLDHDDELAPFALYEVVKLLNKKPDVDFIYSDEDKIEGAGKRCDAFFKPDWSPDLMLSCMYTCHLGIYRRDLVSKMGGLREGFEGSQDYDFVLRFTEYTVPERIAHISKILYHWRKIPGSIASEPQAKNCINIQSAKIALNDMLVRRGIKGNVYDGKWISSYRIKRDLTAYPKVSIIIPTRDNIKLLKNCISSIKTKTTYKNYELIVVDNNSIEPDTIDYLSKLDDTVIKYPNEFNFSEINNLAVNYAKGDYLLFLNNDTEVITPDWIETMLEHAQRPEVGAVGCKLLYSDNTIQHAGVILGLSPDPRNKVAGHIFIKCPGNNPGYFGLIDTIRDYSAVTAAAMMIRKDTFSKVGGFDENLAVSYNDVDLCLKIREKDLLIVYTPYAELIHHESKSRGGNLNESEVDYMLKKWGNVLNKDPYYNPNLSLRSVSCEVDV
jgi:O-antigen biosynthesis protein